jgi:hypothetical protein
MSEAVVVQNITDKLQILKLKIAIVMIRNQTILNVNQMLIFILKIRNTIPIYAKVMMNMERNLMLSKLLEWLRFERNSTGK